MFTFDISASGTRLFGSRAVIVAALALLACAGAAPAADGPHLGQPISPGDAAAWDISIGPDGVGLPPGSGTPAQGAVVYAQKCAACHGDKGEGKTNARLVGGQITGPGPAVKSRRSAAQDSRTNRRARDGEPIWGLERAARYAQASRTPFF